ncbi:replication factor C subunit 1 isoform X2 [Humulus lupulus]|uniref:replication factor C subunit 1 isoform X2 n=1 Tax=Humulus lupulus TaxID=3486 RepID=UPI002B412900|nr:replication factor C subunit 1 isoform X2 [Humulus lupulus]
MSQSDIRKWFMKSHDKDKGNGNAAAKPAKSAQPPSKASEKSSQVKSQLDKQVQASEDKDNSGRRKTSKYFAEKEKERVEVPAKRKTQNNGDDFVKPSPAKKNHEGDDDDDDDFVMPDTKKNSADATPRKKLKSGSGRGAGQKPVNIDESDGDDDMKDVVLPSKSGGRGRDGRGASATSSGGRGAGQKPVNINESDGDDDIKDVAPPSKSVGRGRGGRGASATPSGGRGRGAGRGGFMNFGERKDPPNKGQKEVPEGTPDCLAGLTFVISGTLDSLEREEAEDLIKRHGGRVTGSVSKKTNYLLCDEDIGGRKSEKAKELGTAFLTEDGLFDKIRASNKAKAPRQESKKSMDNAAVLSPKKTVEKTEIKKCFSSSPSENVAKKGLTSGVSLDKKRVQTTQHSALSWTEKYKPKVPNDIIGNQSLVKQLHDWLTRWHDQFLDAGSKKKGKKASDSGAKKAVLLSGTPGIGKTTSAKLVCQMLGFQTIEVNASDSRGKADAKIEKGIGGSNANSIKELVSNEALSVNMDWSKHPKTVLIMDEVDGMSAGDRGGVADLISSIKISKIPIICICNDRYSQKLKSLVNYCLLLSFRKPTKQQMAKRLMQIAKTEDLQVNEIALEELAERVNGDMRMAINQLHYMSLSMSVIKYDDVRQRLLMSAKDEDISPFTAVDKLFGFNSGKLRMDEKMDLSMSDPDLVPLIIQENYINFRPSSVGKDDDGIKRMNLIARAAESIGDGDIFNVQIRKYRQWQLSQNCALSSSIIPSALLHGQRETFEQGERNFNRFGGWLGKNSTRGKNLRLMEDLHVHILASRESNFGRETVRIECLTLLLKRLTEPLRVLPKDEAVREVVDFMNTYSISQEDFDTIVELSKFKGYPDPLEGIPPAVKSALTRAYKEGSKSRMVRVADFVTLPGIKKAPKKRIAAILEPSDNGIGEINEDVIAESEEEKSSDTDDLDDSAVGEKLQKELQSLNRKGVQVQLDLKDSGKSSAKKTPAGRGKGGSGTAEKKGARGSGSGAKRKR